jgi:hypothetical protein
MNASDHNVPALDADVRALLDSVEGVPEPVSGAVRAQMRRRLDVAVAAAGAPSQDGRTTTRDALRIAERALFAAVGAAVGAAGLAMVTELREPPSAAIPRASTVEVSAVPSTPEASISRDEAVASGARSGIEETAPTRIETRESVGGPSLAAESRLIDTARAALIHRDFQGALAAVDRHTTHFPRGVFAEERDAIAIQALFASGRVNEARAAAERFRTAYARSVFLPLLDSAAARAIP